MADLTNGLVKRSQSQLSGRMQRGGRMEIRKPWPESRSTTPSWGDDIHEPQFPSLEDGDNMGGTSSLTKVL